MYGPMRFTRSDLVASTIQRGRDFGLRSYTEVRKALNLPPVKAFEDIHLELNSTNPQVNICKQRLILLHWTSALKFFCPTVAQQYCRTVRQRHLKTGALPRRTAGVFWWSRSSFLRNNLGPVWTHQKWRPLLVREQAERVSSSLKDWTLQNVERVSDPTRLCVLPDMPIILPQCDLWGVFQFVHRWGDRDDPQCDLSWRSHRSYKCRNHGHTT